MIEYTYKGKEDRATAEKLKQGETCWVLGIGNSMTPVLKNKQAVICAPVTEETVLKKKRYCSCQSKGTLLLTFHTWYQGKW